MKSGKLIPLIFGASALLIASSMFLMMEIADRTVAANAERISMAWANYIRSRLTDIEGTVSGEQLTERKTLRKYRCASGPRARC